MSTQTLSAVSLETIGHYSNAAKAIVGAYRTGTTRLLQGLEGRLATGLNNERVTMSESLKNSLLAVEQQITSLIHGSIEGAASVAERAIEAAANAAATSVNTAAAAGSQVQTSLPGNSAEAIVTMNMPAAQLSRDVAARLAEVAQKVSERVAAGEPVVTVEDITPAVVATPAKHARAAR
ncbi:hypothetical protein BH11PSE9_BH11PSE9_05370 [soil metagenome]